MSDRRKDETVLSAAIVAALEGRGIPVERIQSGVHKVKRGWLHCASEGTPDLMTPLGMLEVKVPGKKPSAAQQEWHQRWANWGVHVAVVTSVKDAVEVITMWQAERGGRR